LPMGARDASEEGANMGARPARFASLGRRCRASIHVFQNDVTHRGVGRRHGIEAVFLLHLIVPFSLNAASPRATFPTTNANVHTRRNSKSECFPDLGQVKLVHVEYFFERVRCICLEIRSIAIFRGLMQKVVLLQ